MVQWSHHIHRFGELSVDLEARQATVSDKPVDLEPRLFDLLAYFAGRGHEVVTKDDLLEKVWDGRIVTDAAVVMRETMSAT